MYHPYIGVNAITIELILIISFKLVVEVSFKIGMVVIFGQDIVGAQSSLEKILLHVINRGYLDCFLIETLDVGSKGFVFPMHDCFECCLRHWLVARSSEVP